MSTLSASQLVTLGALLVRIEQHYGSPQDVEWCHDGEQFWIVQSRPVTTAGANPQSAIQQSRMIRNPRSAIRNPIGSSGRVRTSRK